jgi:hypothetical protein
MTKSQVTKLQRDLNTFTNKRLLDVTPVRVDGDRGPATNNRIRFVKYYLGYNKHNRQTAAVTQTFLDRLEHDRSLKVYGRRALAYAIKRRAHQRLLARRERRKNKGRGFGTFDGKTVAAWMVPILQKSRAHGWRGTVTSGVRTPAYSEHLCFAMCGHPTCPGRCAGRSSNHNMLASQGKPHGALDVTFYEDFGRIQHQIGSPLVNHLGSRDPVHFSVSGR